MQAIISKTRWRGRQCILGKNAQIVRNTSYTTNDVIIIMPKLMAEIRSKDSSINQDYTPLKQKGKATNALPFFLMYAD